eukprot:3441228-Rhodomonas_salina.1
MAGREATGSPAKKLPTTAPLGVGASRGAPIKIGRHLFNKLPALPAALPARSSSSCITIHSST